ncbi:amidase family protein [Nocardia sp. NBC_00511]|uniref:amidase family protein n=1 Tax=Nocardia sp. NBC_00511 TaxID=2903591 RepID=UPI0030DF1767
MGERAAEFDRSVWRQYGTPLVAATGTGPLSGHTVAVKDLYEVAGHPLGGGVPQYLGEPRTSHATVVSRLLSAGADIAGIAHTDEFAYSITGGNGAYGMPVNPAAPQRIPGGSSSGSAVAVARGEAAIGLGTDTAGSIRVPAAYQGLWGIRTSHGVVPSAGILPLAQSFDTVGWMARDPYTLATVAECLLPEPDSNAPRLIVDPLLSAVADDELAAASLAVAEQGGAEQVDLDADLDSWFAAFRTVQAFEAWANHGAWITAHPDALSPEVAQRFTFASTVTSAGANAARERLRVAAETLNGLLRESILILPTTATVAPLRMASAGTLESGRTRTLHLTCLASIAGGAAVTMPVATVQGVPNGVCLLGAPGADRSVIRAAIAISRRMGFTPR